MRLDKPRVEPAPPAEWDADQAELMQRFEGQVLNVFTTLIHHPRLFRRWLVFANHVLGKSTLSVRDRELLILRTAWNAQSEYEWGQHVLIARREGMAEADIEAARGGPEAAGIGAKEALLLSAADELSADTMLSEATWAGLSVHYDRRQLIDLIFTVGQYTMLAMALNSLGVQRDAEVPGF